VSEFIAKNNESHAIMITYLAIIGDFTKCNSKSNILADPDEENIISIKTLFSNGFVKIKDGDYRKKI